MSKKIIYKLGDEIAHGVKYFGQDSIDKQGNRTSICICPKCGEQWRVPIAKVKNGSRVTCCGRGFQKKATIKNSVDKECIKIRYNGYNFSAIQTLFPNTVEVFKENKEKYIIISNVKDEYVINVGEYIYYSCINGVYKNV